jgi:hypothetical protein
MPNFLVKSLISSTLIISFGYSLMILTTPSKESLKKEILKYREIDGNNEIYKLQVKTIKENSKLDNPIWMVKFPSRSDLGGDSGDSSGDDKK